jgi:hypothetical protein
MEAPIEPCRGRESSSRTPFPPISARAPHRVRDRVPDVVYPLTAPRDETPDRGVRRERLEELDVRPAGVGGEHDLAHALLDVRLLARHGEPEHAHVPFNGGLKRPASDPHMIDS